MTYTIEEINGCTKKIFFHFDSPNLAEEIQKILKQRQKTVNLKGFRKGKAPLDMIKKIYGPQVQADAVDKFVRGQIFDVINKEELNAIGHPSLENMQYRPGEKMSFEVSLEVTPKVILKELSQYHFTKEKVQVSDQEFEDLKKNYLESNAQMVPSKDSVVRNGHFVAINFKGEMVDGTFPKEMQGEEFLLEIGSRSFIPGFEEGIVGMKLQEKRSLELVFPTDYGKEELQNAKVKFHIELLEIKEKQYLELTEEKAKELNYESIDDFNKKIRNQLENRKNSASKEKLKHAILNKLIEDNNFDIPVFLIAQQEKHLKDQLEKSLPQKGFTEKMMEEYFTKHKKDLTDKAIFQVKSSLILESLCEKFSIETSESDLNAKIAETADNTGMSVEEVTKFYTANKEIKNNAMYSIREEKIFEKIFEQTQISEV